MKRIAATLSTIVCVLAVLGALLLPVSVVALYVGYVTLVMDTLFDPVDTFADNLEIPDDLVFSDPREREFERPVDEQHDALRIYLREALRWHGGDNPTLRADIDVVEHLHAQHPSLLLRYLCAHLAWLVVPQERGFRATRRDVQGPARRAGLLVADHFTHRESTHWSECELSLTINLSNGDIHTADERATSIAAGETARVGLVERSGASDPPPLLESRCLITSASLTVEITETSNAPERRGTKAALLYLNETLLPLIASPCWETARAMLPPDAIVRGEPSIELTHVSQSGIYDVDIRANPGEPGVVYLKAFEVTHDTPLSAHRMRERFVERIGWSDNPTECFLARGEITIYEGDHGKPYAARFEVWFIPDQGGTERKLLERVFRVEGWQR